MTEAPKVEETLDPNGYEYVAVNNGTLSGPYRYVKKGQTVKSRKPIKASWLVLKKDMKPEKGDLPLMSNMKVLQRDGVKVTDPNDPTARKPAMATIKDDGHDRAMAGIKYKEGFEDGAKAAQQGMAALSPTPPAPQGQSGGEGTKTLTLKQGTGDKDVL